jgi:hypothetical protein
MLNQVQKHDIFSSFRLFTRSSKMKGGDFNNLEGEGFSLEAFLAVEKGESS